jgi:zinc D-Ala-D-Ala carboxypeptidase
MNLSKNFTQKEFETTSHNLTNTMNSEQIKNAMFLCEKVLEPLRTFTNKPLRINSGFRGTLVNKAVGGSTTSQHCKGEAADLPIDKAGFDYIKDHLVFDQLIWEFGTNEKPGWVHVSIRVDGKNRKQILRATKAKNGKTVYSPY